MDSNKKTKINEYEKFQFETVDDRFCRAIEGKRQWEHVLCVATAEYIYDIRCCCADKEECFFNKEWEKFRQLYKSFYRLRGTDEIYLCNICYEQGWANSCLIYDAIEDEINNKEK